MTLIAVSSLGIVKGLHCNRCDGSIVLEREDYDWICKCIACGRIERKVNRNVAVAYRHNGKILLGRLEEVVQRYRELTPNRVHRLPLPSSLKDGQN